MRHPLFSIGLAVALAATAAVWRHGPAPADPLPLDADWPPLHDLTQLEHALAAPPAGPAASCADDVRVAAALVNPARSRDRDGEWVRLVNREPVPITLDGWKLSDGRRTRRLGGTLEAGASLEIGGTAKARLRPVQLRNSAGRITLIAPCGVVRSTLSWGPDTGVSPGPGEGLWQPDVGPNENGPDQACAGGADGGYGQT